MWANSDEVIGRKSFRHPTTGVTAVGMSRNLPLPFPMTAASQTELASDVRLIKNFQKSMDGKISVINTRLNELEARTRSVDELRQSACSIQSSLQVVDARLDSVDSRRDEIEDR
ncbi:hypothetical protein HPB50_026212 [Hyalomma asiaticum]|uniref:Uncharacterized protein n=1 Tax=Hyalomma asiaticum TaxID=266040 RepID=A0ACB7S3F9_HYAAI|nr:hypothetical protein HPB50_026212 [Hyalomma asiaticum]